MRVALPSGLEGEAKGFERDTLRIEAPRAYAPGEPVELRLRLPGRELVAPAKAIGSKKNASGGFEVRLRLIGLRHTDLEALANALS